MEQNKQDTFERILSAFGRNCKAVYLIDNANNRYESLVQDSFWKEVLGKEGTLKKMYEALFLYSADNQQHEDNHYNVFADERFFERENYETNIQVSKNDILMGFVIHLIKLSESEAGLLIWDCDYKSISYEREKEKMDAIQDSYLFSMMVDLSKDACVNSNTTESNADRQDFMDIKYSDWRMMIANMFMPEDKSMFLRMSSPEHIINTLEEEKRFKFELQMMNMTGAYIWVRLSFTRMKGFSRENPRFVYTVQDIHQDMLRLLQQQSIAKAVEEQNEKLQQADKERSKFISHMSHEIRTPINAVLGLNEMIIREAEDSTIRAYAYDIKNAGKTLLGIVNDILDFSKIEAGKMEILPVEYEPVVLINDICNLISTKLSEKALDFHLDIDENLPRKVYGDELRLTQVIVNLLSNAVKYTEKGSVTFSVQSSRTEDGKFAYAVSVKDTGIGIKDEDRDKLFAEYGRLDQERNRRVEGTGLGMGIVVGLLNQMGGKLSVNSVYGEGSEFSFILPQKVVDDTPIGTFKLLRGKALQKLHEAEEPFEAPEARVLVVDDTPINLRIVAQFLKATKVKIDMVSSGEKCLEIMQKKKFDIVFLDHLMPEMDGVETLARIRQLSEDVAKTPVVALTANVTSDAKAGYIGLGFDDFLEKPIVYEEMEAVLRKYIH